ncbi:NADH dehydrogenase subunit F C-terminal domain-containing protein, partial [Salmonella enterica]
MDWYEFFKDAVFSVSISFLGIFIAAFLYKSSYSSLLNFDLINLFLKIKRGPKRLLWDKMINAIYNWSYNRAYIDSFYTVSLIGGIRKSAELIHFF